MITKEHIEKAKDYKNLGPVYFSAQDAAKRFIDQWKIEHLEPLVEDICKGIQQKIWRDFEDWLLCDTECNLQSRIKNMVDDVVEAIISGEEWALNRYVLAQSYSGERVRKGIFENAAEPIINQRIKDLEKELERAKKDLEFHQSRNY